MAEIIRMPKLGFDMAEGTLVRWVRAEGEAVEKGEVLAEIETDKATVEVEAAAGGIVHKHLIEENRAVPVGDPIAVIGEVGEQIDLEAILGDEGTTADPDTAEPAEPAEPVEREAEKDDAKAQRQPEPDAGNGHLPEGVKASPVARRIAGEHDLDLRRMQGSGPGGRIVKKDVEQALERGPQVEGPAAPMPVREIGETERLTRSKLRAAIGRRMTASKQQLPHFYLTADLDAGPLMSLRKQLNDHLGDDGKLSLNDFIVKAAALALREYPNLNASLDGEEIVRHGEVNVGVAVAVEGGLLTVVSRNSDVKPLRALSAELTPMIERAREGKVRPDDVEGSTFTISNLGMFDIDHFIAIINPPEAAILAVGSVRKEPAVVEDEIVVAQRMKVTLSADHRLTDGAEAARWLQVFRRAIEQPVTMLI